MQPLLFGDVVEAGYTPFFVLFCTRLGQEMAGLGHANLIGC